MRLARPRLAKKVEGRARTGDWEHGLGLNKTDSHTVFTRGECLNASCESARAAKSLKRLKTAMGSYWKKLAWIWVWRHSRLGLAPLPLGVGAASASGRRHAAWGRRRPGGLLLLVARLRPHALAGDDVAPFQPAMEIDVGAAARAERIVARLTRLAADRAGPVLLSWGPRCGGRRVVVCGHWTDFATHWRWIE